LQVIVGPGASLFSRELARGLSVSKPREQARG